MLASRTCRTQELWGQGGLHSDFGRPERPGGVPLRGQCVKLKSSRPQGAGPGCAGGGVLSPAHQTIQDRQCPQLCPRTSGLPWFLRSQLSGKSLEASWSPALTKTLIRTVNLGTADLQSACQKLTLFSFFKKKKGFRGRKIYRLCRALHASPSPVALSSASVTHPSPAGCGVVQRSTPSGSSSPPGAVLALRALAASAGA